MTPDSKILIAGAGPAGLSCALELLRLGFSPRIAERVPAGKARDLRRGLTIRPRTLALLETLGVAERLISAGHKISALRVEEDGRVLARFDLSGIGGAFPFLLCVPEEIVVSILSDRLQELGGRIEHGLAVTNVRIEADSRALVHFSDGTDEFYDRLIGADGQNSTVRAALGIPFTGYDYPGGWFYADEAAEEMPGAGVLSLLPGGGMAFTLPGGAGTVRRVSNMGFEGALPLPVSVRRAQSMERGGVRLIGTAGAAHGPLGGIGMSRAIEEAILSAQQTGGANVGDGQDAQAALELAETIIKAGRIKGGAGRFFRAYILFLCARVPGFRRRMLRALSGL